MRVPRGGGGGGSPARSPGGGGGGGASGFSRAFVSPPLTPTNLRQWWSPPRSPFGLLEEILWEDEWKLLVACMMLNCTTRLQVDRVLWRLFTLIPTPEEAVRLGREGGGEEATEDPFRDEDAAKSGLDRIEDILAPLGLHRKRARAFVRLSEEYLAARPNQALPAPDAPAGTESGRVAGESANSPAPPGSSQAPRRSARAASNAGGVAARSRSVRERRACHVLRGTDGGGAEGPRASVVVRVGGGTEGERQEGSREKKGEYRLAEGRATHGRRTRGRRVCVFSRHGVWCLSGVRRGGRVGIDSRRAISPRMISLEFMYLAHPAWLKPPIVIRQSVESPARWLNLPVSPRRPRTSPCARGRRPVSTSVGLEFRADRDVHLERARVDVARREPALGKSPLGLAGRGPSSWIPSSRSSPSRVCLRTPSPRRPCTACPPAGSGPCPPSRSSTNPRAWA